MATAFQPQEPTRSPLGVSMNSENLAFVTNAAFVAFS